MALFNNQTSYVDENIAFGRQAGNHTEMNSHPTESTNQAVDVIYSTLQPTATEFHPLSSSNGAIRKETQRHSYNRHKGTRPNSYGSGRTFSNSRGYKQKNERSEETLFERQKFSDSNHQNDKNPIGNSNFYYNQNDDNLRGTYLNTTSNPTKYSSNYNYHEGSSNLQSHPKNHYSEDFIGHSSNFGRYNKSHSSNKMENFHSSSMLRKGYNHNFGKKSTYNKTSKDKSRFNTQHNTGYNRFQMEQESFQNDYHSFGEKNNVNFKSGFKSSSDNFTNNKFSRQNMKDFTNQSLKKNDKNFVKIKKGE